MPVTKMLVVTTIALTHKAFLLPLAEHFRKKGWQVDGMAAGIESCNLCRRSYDQVFDVSWRRNPADVRAIQRSIKQIREVVNRERYDIVHVHTPIASWVTRYSIKTQSQLYATRIVYTAHGFHFYPGGPALWNMAFRILEKIAARWTDQLVVINNSDWKEALRLGLVPVDRLWRFPGIGVDLKQYSSSAVAGVDVERIRCGLKLSSEQVLFVMVASFDKGKRHIDVIRALSMLRRRDLVVAFAGEGVCEGDVRAKSQEAGVAHSVRFLGYRCDIPVLMSAARATLYPSEREGLPRGVLESMALGIPVIGANVRGTSDLLRNGGGILVPPRDPRALAEAMAWLGNDESAAREIGRKGVATVGRYRLEQVVSEHERLYERTLGVV